MSSPTMLETFYHNAKGFVTIYGVATKHGVGHGVGHGLSYGLPVVNFMKQFTLEPLKILIIIKHKCEGIAPIIIIIILTIKAKIQIRYI